MDAFTADFLTNLAAELAAPIIAKVARRFQDKWQGDAAARALQRCLHAGILGMVSKASLDEPAATRLLADTFTGFFQAPEVAIEMTRLVYVQPLSVPELEEQFVEAGYDPEDLPGLNFAAAVAAFEAAFLETAAAETALQPIIQVYQLREQTTLQREMVALMRQMAAALSAQAAQPIAIQAGRLVTENARGSVQIIYQWPSGAALPPARSWENHYLRALVSYCDALDVAAVDEAYAADPHMPSIRISDVFTSLYLAHGQQPITRAARQSAAEAILRSPQMAERRSEREKTTPITAVEGVAALGRLVILGYPGGGKSTLVNYLAAQMARRRLGQTSAALPGWPDTAAPLPLRIILRHFAAALPDRTPPGKKGGLVWDYLEKTLLPQWGCQEALPELKHTLTEAGGLILFDGLDEVRESDADERRSLIKEAIADFAAPLTRCKVVVTCREYAYKQGDAWRLPEADFPVVDLALFAPAQIEQFTQTWYQLTGPFKGWDNDRCQREAARLYQASQQWDHLRELAQYPLLLTLMAQVHGRDGTLPEDRADLYERAVNLLLAHWENRIERDVAGERRREPGLIMQLGVRTEILKGALAQVAFEAHEQQEQSPQRTADITREALRETLQQVLGSYDQAEVVTNYVQFRAGLLQARGAFTYTFPHRTFQEYLAALHIWKEANPGGELAARVKRDLGWWREVFLLAAGQQKSTPTNVAELVDWLLPAAAGNNITLAQAGLAALAGQALAETGFMRHARLQEPDYRFTVTVQRIKEWLLAALRQEQIPARERAAAGQVLARLHWPDGRLLDDRPGVGIVLRGGVKLPDITWSDEVPPGRYVIREVNPKYSDEARREVTIEWPYRLSRYPVTNAQFQCFLEAPERNEPEWWVGIPDEERTFSNPSFPHPNHPRERVSWYQAVAFCRWLTAKLHAGELSRGPLEGPLAQYEITLPHEYEWETAARWPPDGMATRVYSWGPDFDAAKANTYEGGIRQTTAVGMYLAGRNAALELYDLSGNVWEWCRNKYDNPGDEAVDQSDDRRVLRGGAWYSNSHYARATYRNNNAPAYRNNYSGFRLVCVRRPPSRPGL